MELSSRVEISCNSEGANFIPQDSADDSKKADKPQRMIVREGLGASTEKPEKEEPRPFKPRFKEWITQFCQKVKPVPILFTCLVLFVCLYFLVYVDKGLNFIGKFESCQELPPDWYAIRFIVSFMLVLVLHIINNEVHCTLQAPFTGVEVQYVISNARPCMQLHRLSTKVAYIPLEVYYRVCLMLNIRRILRFDDFRMLAEKVGLDRYEIKFVEQLENPTDVVLSTWSSSSDATVGRLIELLKDEGLKRMDVAEVLEKWVNNQG